MWSWEDGQSVSTPLLHATPAKKGGDVAQTQAIELLFLRSELGGSLLSMANPWANSSPWGCPEVGSTCSCLLGSDCSNSPSVLCATQNPPNKTLCWLFSLSISVIYYQRSLVSAFVLWESNKNMVLDPNLHMINDPHPSGEFLLSLALFHLFPVSYFILVYRWSHHPLWAVFTNKKQTNKQKSSATFFNWYLLFMVPTQAMIGTGYTLGHMLVELACRITISTPRTQNIATPRISICLSN